MHIIRKYRRGFITEETPTVCGPTFKTSSTLKKTVLCFPLFCFSWMFFTKGPKNRRTVEVLVGFDFGFTLGIRTRSSMKVGCGSSLTESCSRDGKLQANLVGFTEILKIARFDLL